MKTADKLLLAAVAATLAATTPAPAAERRQSLAGAALVFDGDTIMVSLTKIRLIGMDAPEMAQTCRQDGQDRPCGVQARDALAGLIEGKSVACDLSGRHSYGRLLATCHVGDTDLGAWMVGQGWAVVDPRFEQTYAPQQAKAKAARRGVWAGEFQTPCAFRGSC